MYLILMKDKDPYTLIVIWESTTLRWNNGDYLVYLPFTVTVYVVIFCPGGFTTVTS